MAKCSHGNRVYADFRGMGIFAGFPGIKGMNHQLSVGSVQTAMLCALGGSEIILLVSLWNANISFMFCWLATCKNHTFIGLGRVCYDSFG